MTWLDVYLFTRLDPVHSLLVILLVILSFCGGLPIIFLIINGSIENIPEHLKWGKRLLAILIPTIFLLSLFKVALPTSKEFAAIYLIPRIVNNEQVQAVPPKVLSLLNSKLDEWVADALKKVEEKK